MKEEGRHKGRNKNKNKFAGFGKIRVPGHLNYREIVRRFERQSTFHGISHAALAPNTKWRIIWYAAFTICFCALLIQIILLIRRYRTYSKSVDLDMDAFSHVQTDMESNGIAATMESKRKGRKSRNTLSEKIISNRRYHQASALCLCEVNSLTGERKKGSCFAAYKGNISIQFHDILARFHPSKCICQLDWFSKTFWPCFPYNTWKERLCKECSEDLGHCPMRFFEGETNKIETTHTGKKICLCHREYNHCIANNEYGYILEIEPKTDVSSMTVPESLRSAQHLQTTSTTTTTQAPDLKQALGFEGLTDEIAIKEQAKENLMFAVGELNNTAKIRMSQQKHELIYKCSFNQKDCDIDNDFKLHYDQTYGNCYTFNWNRTKEVTAFRAGAKFGLRVLLYADVSEYLPTSESVGFRITIHDKRVVPFPDAFGYSAPTGFLSSYGVRMKKFNRIPAPHGQCLNDREWYLNSIYPGFKYSAEACHRSCTQKEIIRICGCADPAYPIPAATISCKVSDPIARECTKNATVLLGRLIAEGKLANCMCHQSCSEVNYEVTYSAARWPSGTSKVMECDAVDDLCMERYRKNAAMIQIFYEELNYETLTETPAYTLTSALADLGGLTGLWIGASVVSLMEIVALIVYTAQAYVRKRKSASANQLSRPNVYPRYIKRSLSSSISTMSSGQMKISVNSRISEESVIKEPEPAEVTDTMTDTDCKYIPPGTELPCECVFQKEKIRLMSALCPEHGYLVRRKVGRGLYYKVPGYSDNGDDDEDENESESDEEHDINDEEETEIEKRAAASWESYDQRDDSGESEKKERKNETSSKMKDDIYIREIGQSDANCRENDQINDDKLRSY